MIRTGVIGLGYWGPNILRNLCANPDINVLMASDLSEDCRSKFRSVYPSVKFVENGDEIINNPDIDAVAIATPVPTHYPLAKAALQAGKHVWVEKPLTNDVGHAEELVKLASENKLILLTDHTFIYSPAVEKLKDIITRGELGDIYYYDSVRVNLGLFQQSLSVLWDLGPHDISIMEHLIAKPIVWVQAVGARHAGQAQETLAYVTVQFEDNILGHIHVNWLAPAKIRQVLIGGSKRMCLYNDNESNEKVKVYDKGVELNSLAGIREARVRYRLGDVNVPALDQDEPLKRITTHFAHCITTGSQPLTDGQAGLRVVRILDAAQRSLIKEGQRIYLQDVRKKNPAAYYQQKLINATT